MPIRTVAIGDSIELDGHEFFICDYDGLAVKVRDSDTAEYRILRVDEVADAIALPPIETPQPRELEFIPPALRSELERLADHLDEMITGIHPKRPHEFNPLYRPNIPIAVREITKSEELERLGVIMSPRTLRRKRSDYAPEPGRRSLAGLLDRRKRQRRNPLDAVPEEFRKAIVRMIKQAGPDSTKSGRSHRAAVIDNLSVLYPDQTFSMPHKDTLRRWIKIVGAGHKLDGTTAQRVAKANRPQHVYASRKTIMPGHEVQIDSSKFDILVRDTAGNVHAATLVAMIDKHTRSVCASGVYENNNGLDLTLLLARALSPRRRWHQSMHFAHVDVPIMPWAKNLTHAEREELDERVPFIFPQRLLMDNGADYRSDVFMSACERFGIDVTFAPPGSGWVKGIVEKFFDDVTAEFAERLPGYKARRVADRSAKEPNPDDLLTIDQLAELWDEWVTVVWQNREHNGLTDPMNRGRRMTPNKMYIACYPISAPVPLPLTRDEYIALLPAQFRAITDNGVVIDHRRYDNDLLVPFRGSKSGDRLHGGKWPVRYDPYDPAAVWVQDPETSEWIECEWKNQRWINEPQSKFIRRQVAYIDRHAPALSTDEGSDLVAEAVRALQINEKQLTKTQRRAERAGVERAKTGVPQLRNAAARAEPDDDFIDMPSFDPKGLVA
ncbi:DDE-type integrase/transposase/recombinase [Curtobacterium flaccumfaciens pv. flaccumfaciens]|uniref:Mu transposase C-terminal domain-containing protein n=1 Tax=Curtobacterium flaccumfaciens TaxID=2035 RepID=UPI001BD1A850|nr:Mu transposase C-terminal domain-containing protein [Curtobacterium flaccumfaciens]QVG65540.1 DDE-type integrase/transposase/recombinase [Curtobacterium flaccumfaciens pv. flaccumfaciens]